MIPTPAGAQAHALCSRGRSCIRKGKSRHELCLRWSFALLTAQWSIKGPRKSGNKSSNHGSLETNPRRFLCTGSLRSLMQVFQEARLKATTEHGALRVWGSGICETTSSILELIHKLGSFHLHVPNRPVRDVAEEVSAAALCVGGRVQLS